MKTWQQVLKDWLISTLGRPQFESTHERAMRFAEESAELCQAVGLSYADFLKVTQHAYSKPVGEVRQEFGGVIVTLCVLAENKGEVLLDCLIAESNRIHEPENIKKIQAAQKRKQKEGMGM